jgi:hypothetical protein
MVGEHENQSVGLHRMHCGCETACMLTGCGMFCVDCKVCSPHPPAAVFHRRSSTVSGLPNDDSSLTTCMLRVCICCVCVCIFAEYESRGSGRSGGLNGGGVQLGSDGKWERGHVIDGSRWA